LTESEQPNYEIIPKSFEGNDIEFILINNETWITAETLGKGLEYNNPRKSMMNLYYSHNDEIEEYKGVIELMTPGGPQQTTVFNEMGAYLLIMFSNQPKAKDFRKWVANVVKEIRRTGGYIEKYEKGSMEWALQTVEVMKTVLLHQKKQEERLKQLEEKDRYIFVIPRTKRILRDEVDRVAKEYFNGHHYKVWNPLKAQYKVSRYEEFKEKEAQAILKHFALKYPPKNIENEELEEF